MKKYLYIKDYEIPLYRGLFVIILSNSIKLIEEKIKKISDLKISQKELFAHEISNNNYKGKESFIIILNFDNPNYGKIDHGTITHEVIHVVNRIGYHRGFIEDFLNDEPIAYLSEWITNRVYEFIKKYKFDIK